VKANASANQVDGISGATMTCNGVTSMMQGSLGNYLEFLKQ
jgi:Na+-transporting NADH:ubiquinone oxidoreductase subunit NqrC